jgi:hypothetical protein
MQSSHRQARRFSTPDLIILTAATVAGLAWLWLVAALEGFYFNALPTAALIADPLLSTWTLAWLTFRFRGPRPRWRRLVRQPGAAVGFVAVLAWPASMVVMLRWGADVHHGTPDLVAFAYVLLASATMLGGFGVLVAWAGSAADGSWRPEGSWVDRMGRALGVGWIALSVPSGILLRTLTAPYY